VRAAKEAGLRYVSDEVPGIRRVRRGKSFAYVAAGGKPVRDEATLGRIESLVIPPAWEEVWIAPSANAHLQATGRDERGRKQSRYHPKWRETRDSAKFDKVIAFGRAIPHIRSVTKRHMRLPGLPREKVLAAVVRCLETTLIRVGNEEYASTNKSYGLTTIRDGHADVRGPRVHFDFKGKSGVRHEIELTDRQLAKIIRASQELPGQELFQYVDDRGKVRDVKSDDVNAYLREIAGDEFTAKDFRTWAGTVLAAGALQELEHAETERGLKKNVVAAVEQVAKRLGNTKAVCRKCYIHPAVLDAYLDGSLLDTLKQRADKAFRGGGSMKPEEEAVLRFLRGQDRGQKKSPVGERRRAMGKVRGSRGKTNPD
jgi:DNA topoisomerase-1